MDNLSSPKKVKITVFDNDTLCLFNGTTGDPMEALAKGGPCYITPFKTWEASVTKVGDKVTEVNIIPKNDKGA